MSSSRNAKCKTAEHWYNVTNYCPTRGWGICIGLHIGDDQHKRRNPGCDRRVGQLRVGPDSPAGWDLVWHGAFFDIVVLAGLVALLDTDESWSLRGSMLGVRYFVRAWPGLAMR